MGWWILFGLAALGLSIYGLCEEEYGWFGFFGVVILSQLFAFALTLIACAISGAFIGCNSENLSESYETTPIYALADNNAISGSFFLGSGSVDEELRYYYIVDAERGKHIEDVVADRAYIVESDNPTLTVVSYGWKNKGWDWLGICLVKNDYIFAIPAGSILNNYRVDLK